MQQLLDTIPKFLNELDGVVFYIDGGMRSVLGVDKATFGMHAYFYSDEVTKKNHGAKDFLPTPTEYVEKSKVSTEEKCTVLQYYDSFGPSPGGTNQTAEMDALVEALQIILQSKIYEKVKRIHIYSDSQVVVKGTQEWMQNWKQRNWISSSGLPVSNRPLWEVIDKLWHEVKATGVEIKFSWVKGHASNHGNILADYMASTGLFHNDSHGEKLSEAANYYTSDVSTSKLLLDSKLYHLYEIKPFVDDQAQYLTFSHPSQGFDVKDDVGKRVRDFGIGIVRLKKSEGVVDKILEVCTTFNERVADVPIIVNLQNILKPNVCKEILNGMVGNYNVTSENQVKSLNNENLLTIINPSRLAYKLKPIYSDAAGVLDMFLDNDDSIGIFDVTDLFYQKVEKKNVTSLKFKLATESFIQVPATFKLPQSCIPNNVIRNVTITFGNDTPQRRTFAAIADLEPKISVVTWEESEKCYRYALIIETIEGVGLWCGCFDNSIFIR